jgi:hypothetical protein
MCFSQAEAQFILATISNERTNFSHVISQLNQQNCADVENIITNSPQKGSDTTLSTERVNRLAPLREQRIRQVLALERVPSQFLTHLRSFALDVSDTFFHSICSSLIPHNIRTIFADHPERRLNAEGRCADRISEVAPQQALAKVVSLTVRNALRQNVGNFSRQMKALSAERTRSRYSPWDSSSNSRNSRPGAKFNSTVFLSPAAKPIQETSTAPQAYAENTGLIFIKEKCSNQHFLVDTGSDICVFPRNLIPQPKKRGNFDLYAANGTAIATYGLLPLSLNMGLRRHFTWQFVVADVSHPLIGADFLSHFGLLVDCRNNRLLDGFTFLNPVMKATPATAPPATSSTAPGTQTTRSGRRVRLPARFNA